MGMLRNKTDPNIFKIDQAIEMISLKFYLNFFLWVEPQGALIISKIKPQAILIAKLSPSPSSNPIEAELSPPMEVYFPAQHNFT